MALGGPKEPKPAKKSDDDDKASPVVGGVAGYAKKIGSGIGGRIGREQLLPPPGSFRPNEVLAINANPASLARAIASGQAKVIEEIRLPALRTNITRLETPHGSSGLSELREVLSADTLSLNLVYRSVVSPPAEASQSGPAPQPRLVPQSGAVPTGAGVGSVLVKPGVVGCTPDRCFGAGLIKWQPQLTTCVSKALKIGVIDTGLDKSHPAFADIQFVHKETEFLPPKSKKPSNQHGTGIFSLLAGNKNSTTPGLIPDASYYVGDAFYTDGAGLAISDTTTMLKALNWLKSERVDIANLSFAGPKDDLVHAAIIELASTGTVVVAAAGNEGPDAPPSYPAAFREVIAVTAVNKKLEPYRYANRGSYIAVAAPGVDVWTALPGRREGPQTGTSFAVPYVTSVIALGYPSAAQRSDGDPLAPKQRALALLQKGVLPISGGSRDVVGAGLVQAPRECAPRGPVSVAGSWAGTVQPVAASPNERSPAASWTGTVQPAPAGSSWESTVKATLPK